MNVSTLRNAIAVVLFCVATALSGLLMTGCGSDGSRNLLETVPSDSRAVAVVNVEKLLKNAGCKVSDRQIVLTEDLQIVVESMSAVNQSLVQAAAAIAPTVDMTGLVIYITPANRPVATFRITSPASFATLAAAAAKSSGKDSDMTVYRFDGYVVAADGDQGWVATAPDDLKQAIAGDDNRFSRFSNVAGLLDEHTKAVAMAVNCDGDLEQGPVNGSRRQIGNAWLCATLEFNRSIAGLDMFVMGDDGQRFEMSPYIGPIDIDFLRFVPENSEFVASIGKINDIDDIFKAVDPWLSGGLRGDLRSVMPYLRAIDGTTSVAANPAASAQYLRSLDLDSWDVTAMTHLKQSETNSLLTMARMFCSHAGFTAEDNGDGVTAYRNGNMTCYLGSVDGYLIGSTRQISGNRNNSFTQVFSGKLAAAVVDVPFGGETAKALNLPWGFYCSLCLEDDIAKAKFRLNGVDTPVLEALAALAARNAEVDASGQIVAAYDDFSDDPEYADLEPVE